MKNTTFARGVIGAALAASLWLPSITQAGAPVAPPSTVPVNDFFKVAEMGHPVISPDGAAIAILIHNAGGHRVLAVVDTADLTRIKVVATFGDESDVVNAR